MEKSGYSHLIPFRHENFDLWTQSLHFGAEGRLHTIHKETNLKVGGGLDDVWFNRNNGQLHVVDYKSTSTKKMGKSVSIDDWWKISYKRQMDLYVWVLRRLGFEVSDTGYFLYCDADRFAKETFLQESGAIMYFKMSLLEYSVDCSWIEPNLFAIRILLDNAPGCPHHHNNCEYGNFLGACEVSQIEGL